MANTASYRRGEIGSKGPLAMKLYNDRRRRRILDSLHELLLSKLVARPATSAGTPSQAAWPPPPPPPPPPPLIGSGGRRTPTKLSLNVSQIHSPKGSDWRLTFFSRIHFLPRLMGRFAAHFTVYGRFWGSSSVFYLCWVYSLFYRMFKHIYE